MKNWRIPKCLELQATAAKLIPGMTQLLSKRPDMYSRGVWPTYFKEAHGTEVIDLDDNTYIDCSIGGIGATVLGYADPDVNKAVISVIESGSASTLNPPEEVALAQKLIELHPWAEMARFARSGGEAMAMAVRIARVATKKDVVVFCGYHGWMDWYLAANLGKTGALDDQWIPGLPPNGIPKGLKGTAIPFRFNNMKSFEDAITQAGDNLAAIVMEPIRNYEPSVDFMAKIHTTAKAKHVPLVIDEISAGFRICNGGAHLVLGWQPDIAVFSKALGNGYPVSAVIGRSEFMASAQESFITSTNWTERIGPTAALAMIDKFIRIDASTHLIAIADKVWKGWELIARKHGITIDIGGFKPMIHFSFQKDNNINRAFYTQEMLKRGFLAGTGFYSMYAHTAEQVDKYLMATDEVFGDLKKHIDSNSVMFHLEGKPAVTGFGRIN
jgi:glutamate-1-semialdehyde 2,1-aminomutase